MGKGITGLDRTQLSCLVEMVLGDTEISLAPRILGPLAAVRAVAQGDAVLTPRVTKELIARGVPRALPGAQREGLRERFGALTPRELDVARLIAEGMSNEEIAERLVLQPASVRRNVSRILAKLHLRDRVQIAVAWYKSN